MGCWSMEGCLEEELLELEPKLAMVRTDVCSASLVTDNVNYCAIIPHFLLMIFAELRREAGADGKLWAGGFRAPR